MKENYKKLNLNRDEIIKTVVKYCEINYNDFDVAENFEDKGGTRRRLNIEIEGNLFFIDAHFNGDGTTTLENFGGNEVAVAIKKEICFFVKENCLIGDNSKNQWFVAKGITESEFISVVELVKESRYCKETINEDIEKKMYKYCGIYGEKLTITYYNQKSSKIVLQGRPLLLFFEATEIITNLVDLEELPKLFNDNYKVHIKKEDIEEQSKIIMECSYDKIWSAKLKRSILQAVYNMNLDADMFDYTGLVFPAYRALEGHLRYVLKDNGITLSSYKFNIFEKNKELNEDSKALIQSHCIDSVKSGNIIKYIENSYMYFCDKRHVYFHWNNPNDITHLDDTRVIESREQARGLIKETLEYIEKYFVMF